MSVINQLLALSLNHLIWVILGLLFWVGTYWQLYTMKSDTFADVVTLILSVLPIGVAFISLNVAVARWSGKTHSQAMVFLILGLAAVAYSVIQYARDTKVQKVLKDRKIANATPGKNVRLIIKILVGAISVLVSVTLLISGGWELIQGSVITGIILAPIGGTMLLLDRWPNWQPWNVFKLTYTALMEGTASESDVAAHRVPSGV